MVTMVAGAVARGKFCQNQIHLIKYIVVYAYLFLSHCFLLNLGRMSKSSKSGGR